MQVIPRPGELRHRTGRAGSIRWARTPTGRCRRSSTATRIAACCWRSIAAPSTAATATAGGWWGRRRAPSPAPDLDDAIDYIRRTPAIRDVLISGGDPLTLSTRRLEEILAAVRSIEHVEIVRIGTRVPVVLPMRVDDELCAMLRRYHPLFINTHFNHPQELTPQARAACERLADAGIPHRQPDGAAAGRQLVGAGAARAVHRAAALPGAAVLPVPGRRRRGHGPPAHVGRDRHRAHGAAARPHLRPGHAPPGDRHARRHGQGEHRPRLRASSAGPNAGCCATTRAARCATPSPPRTTPPAPTTKFTSRGS